MPSRQGISAFNGGVGRLRVLWRWRCWDPAWSIWKMLAESSETWKLRWFLWFFEGCLRFLHQPVFFVDKRLDCGLLVSWSCILEMISMIFWCPKLFQSVLPGMWIWDDMMLWGYYLKIRNPPQIPYKQLVQLVSKNRKLPGFRTIFETHPMFPGWLALPEESWDPRALAHQHSSWPFVSQWFVDSA